MTSIDVHYAILRRWLVSWTRRLTESIVSGILVAQPPHCSNQLFHRKHTPEESRGNHGCSWTPGHSKEQSRASLLSELQLYFRWYQCEISRHHRPSTARISCDASKLEAPSHHASMEVSTAACHPTKCPNRHLLPMPIRCCWIQSRQSKILLLRLPLLRQCCTAQPDNRYHSFDVARFDYYGLVLRECSWRWGVWPTRVGNKACDHQKCRRYHRVL